MIPPQLMQSSGSSDRRFSIQPLTILGVTGPFSVLAENVYSLCVSSFDVSQDVSDLRKVLKFLSLDTVSSLHGVVTYPRRMDALSSCYYQCS